MSKFSGKCDLYDHVFMIGSRDTTADMSELEKFEVFKQRTEGKIYQSRKLTLEKWNIDYEIQYIDNPNILRKEKENGRWKYYYYGKKFASLTALNKYGYYTLFTIKIDTLLDLIPYYPYVISILVCSDSSDYIQICSTSQVDSELMEPWRKVKYDGDSYFYHYRDALRDELIRVAKEYY